MHRIMKFARESAAAADSLTGSRMMVVGMPNVGKSSMINALRSIGVGGPKAAKTGAQPGVTRKIAGGIKIAENPDGSGKVYLIDTPGVFLPYVTEPEAMLKLSLVGCVKDTIIQPMMIADYLLYHLNLRDPWSYEQVCRPTNDVEVFVEAVARKTGRVKAKGVVDMNAAALWIVQRWRSGHLGRFLLDEVTEDGMEKRRMNLQDCAGGVSLHQAKKIAKQKRAREGHQIVLNS